MAMTTGFKLATLPATTLLRIHLIGSILMPGLILMPGPSVAEAPGKTTSMQRNVHVVQMFDQILSIAIPPDFALRHKSHKDRQYEMIFVAQPELPPDAGREFITISALRATGQRAKITPKQVVDGITLAYKHMCPNSFRGMDLGSKKISGLEGHAVLVACGRMPIPEGVIVRDSVLVLSVRKGQDYYSVLWSERGKAQDQPPEFAMAAWSPRIDAVMKMRFCDWGKGDKESYVRCSRELGW